MITIVKLIQKKTFLSDQESWWMLEHITQKKKALLLHSSASSLSKQELLIINSWIKKLTQESIPLSYLLGSIPFLNLTINVKPPILIPRTETEEWVADLIQILQPHEQSIKTILEIGTGSGCIALALAKSFPNAMITATDINHQALNLAQDNATLNKVNNIKFINSDIFENINDLKFDIIVSNPPYIDPIHKKTILPQVLKWEDEKALFANKKGLDLIYKIMQNSRTHLHFQPILPYQIILEHDHDQHERINAFAKKQNLDCINKKDSFGKIRTSWLKVLKERH